MQDLVKKVGFAAAAAASGLVMLGATMAGALAANLGTLPAPFVSNNDFVGQIVVGRNAEVPDVIAAAQLAAAFGQHLVSASAGTTTTASGGRLEEVVMGKELTLTGQFPSTLKSNHISTLSEGKVTFESTDYDYREEIVLTTDAKIMTGQDDKDDDYDTTKAFLQIKKGSVLYKYNFYGTSKPNATLITSSDYLLLNILGQEVKITDADASTDSLTAEVGVKVWLKTGETATVSGKSIKVDAIGSDSVIVSVGGVISDPIDKDATTATTVNGVKVKVNGLIYQSNAPETSGVSLLIGDEVTKEYADGDEFIGEDEDDPAWVWDIDMDAAGSINYVGAIYNKDLDNYKDGPAGVGESFMLPGSYLKISPLTMSPSADLQYTFDFDTGVSLYDSTGADLITSSAKILRIYTTADTGFTDGTNDAKEIALYYNSTGIDYLQVFYKDGSKYKQDTNLALNGTYAGWNTGWYLQYGDTLPYVVVSAANATGYSEVKFAFDTVSGATDVDSDITVNATLSSGYAYLGATEAQADAVDVLIDTTASGTFDGSLLTHYGAILYNAKSNADNDQVVIKIPNAQSTMNVFIGSASGSTSTTLGAVSLKGLNAEVAVLDNEADTTGTPLVIVGGPYANTLARGLIGTPGTDDTAIQTFFGVSGTTGKGVVKLYDSGDTGFSAQAMVVAGWSATDTRAAAYVLSQYLTGAKSLSGLSGKSKITVTATGVTSISSEELA